MKNSLYFIAGIIVLGSIVACSERNKREITETVVEKLTKKSPVVSISNSGESSGRGFPLMLFTMEHDGHRFVVSNSGGILHHPDCPHSR